MTEQQPMGDNPLLQHGLPDWLDSVPLSANKPIPIDVGGDKTVPMSLILGALDVEVGTEVGSMVIAPELAKMFAEFTENSSWLNLPSERTWIKRSAVDSWEVQVGDFTRTFDRAGLQQQVRASVEKLKEG